MAYEVTAGYVTVATAVEGGRAAIDIPRGAILPADVDAETVEALLRRDAITEVASGEPAAVADPDAVPAGSGAAVLAWVGSDKDRAEKALAAEQARDGGPRSSVVTPLTKLTQA